MRTLYTKKRGKRCEWSFSLVHTRVTALCNRVDRGQPTAASRKESYHYQKLLYYLITLPGEQTISFDQILTDMSGGCFPDPFLWFIVTSLPPSLTNMDMMELQFEHIDWNDIVDAELSGDQEALESLR